MARSTPSLRKASGTAPAPRITPELFRFFEQLARHNERDWFNRNKDRYHAVVRDPLLAFIEAFGAPLALIAPSYVADPRPMGGSLFRIYRDTRFAKDKSPYKLYAGIHFHHGQGKGAHAPGFYLHLDPKGVFAGAGIWHPDSPTALAVRRRIVAHAERWKQALAHAPFRKRYQFGDEKLARAPRGFDPEHPLIEDLKRKSFSAHAGLSEREVCAPDFAERLAATFDAATPYMEFLTRAVGLPW